MVTTYHCSYIYLLLLLYTFQYAERNLRPCVYLQGWHIGHFQNMYLLFSIGNNCQQSLHVSHLTASFCFQESIFNNIEQNSKMHVTTLDTKKAFETVWWPGVLNKLFKLGIMRIHLDITSQCTYYIYCCSLFIIQKFLYLHPIAKSGYMQIFI